MGLRQAWTSIAARFLGVGRFTFILTSLILLLILYPFLEDEPAAFALLRILFSLVLVSALYATSGRRWTLTVAGAVFIPAFVVHWANFMVTSRALVIVNGCLVTAGFAFTAGTILASIFRAKQVTFQTLAGSLCVYLLIGLVWAFLYELIELAHPGAFRFPPMPVSEPSRFILGETGFSHFIYYSYTTLTTLGYGDIHPVTSPARTFSYMEAICGQIYLAVLVARLVGLHIVQSSNGIDTSLKSKDSAPGE